MGQSLFCCFLLLVAGCPKPQSNQPKEPLKRPLEGVKLSLAVVKDSRPAGKVVNVHKAEPVDSRLVALAEKLSKNL